MANRYAIGATWNNANNWSTTDGGGGGAGVPTTTDDVFFTGNSISMDVDVAADSKSLDFTGFTQTITMSNTLRSLGNVTLVATMTIAGASDLRLQGTSTITSNGKTWPNSITMSANATLTLADNWTITGSFNNNTTVAVLNGNSLFVGGGVGATGVGSTSGTTIFVMNGTGTHAGGSFKNPLTINTSGTITFTGTLAAGAVTYTYTAGTTITTGHTLNFGAGTSGAVVNTNGMTWNTVNLTYNGTVTFSSDFQMAGTLSVGVTGVNVTVDGGIISIGGGFTTLGTTATRGGTATYKLVGTGTIDMTSLTTGVITNPMIINTNGTITFSTIDKITNGITYQRGVLAGNIVGLPKTVGFAY